VVVRNCRVDDRDNGGATGGGTVGAELIAVSVRRWFDASQGLLVNMSCLVTGVEMAICNLHFGISIMRVNRG